MNNTKVLGLAPFFLFVFFCLIIFSKGLMSQSVSLEASESNVCLGDSIALIASLTDFEEVGIDSFIWLVMPNEAFPCTPILEGDTCEVDEEGFVPITCLPDTCREVFDIQENVLGISNSRYWLDASFKLNIIFTREEENTDTTESEAIILPLTTLDPMSSLTSDPPDATLCPNTDSEFVTLTVDRVACGYTLFWYEEDPEDGDVSPIPDTEDSLTIRVNKPGIYYAREEREEVSREAISITIGEQPDTVSLKIISSSLDTDICEQDVPIILTAEGISCGFQVRWFLGDPDDGGIAFEADSIAISIQEEGTYFVVEENEEGERDEKVSFELMFSESEALESIASEVDSACGSEPFTLIANSVSCGFELKWYDRDPEEEDAQLLPSSEDGLSVVVEGPGTYFAREEPRDGSENFGLDTSIVIAEKEQAMPLESLSPSDTLICAGETVTITALRIDELGTGEIIWFEGEIELTDFQGQESITVNPNSTTEFFAELSGCVMDSVRVTSSIQVKGGSQIRLSGSSVDTLLTPNVTTDLGTYFDGTTLNFSLSSDTTNASFEWDCTPSAEIEIDSDSSLSGSGNSLTLNLALKDGQESGTITCTIRNTNDPCEGEFVIRVEVEGFVIPNILTPNGDNENDVWDLSAISSDPEDFTVKVFSRQGSCVYGCDTQQTLQTAWEGEDCPDGPYWYLIEGPNGFERKGALTILRN
ncbi:MAG: gliding motility-associated C-terminal domain-containing protein [Bacteroidota bacterium]